ncbi:RNA-binding protein 44 [Solea solea]|uniref:RNA-binding protein 44 n=1 Tax=Solea solea TaxID=90069 RepID=UPI00272D1FB6|nr:RNA-binding protein 44 [Solea solea]
MSSFLSEEKSAGLLKNAGGQPAVVSVQSVWPCYPLTLPVELLPRHQYVAWDNTGRVEPSWGTYTSFNPVTDATPNPKKSRKFFLDRSVFDLVDAHPYLSLTDPKLLGWYLGLTPEDRNIILVEGGFHQFLQRHPAFELSNHHVYVKYPVGKVTPVLPTLTSISQKSESSSGAKTGRPHTSKLPRAHLQLEMHRSHVKENLVHLRDNVRTAGSSSITQEPSHQRILTERADAERPPWQMSGSVAVCKDPAADLANFSLDMELERRRGHVLVKQNEANITAKVCPLQSQRSNDKESSSEYFDVDDRSIVQSVKPQQVNCPTAPVCGKEKTEDEDEDATDESEDEDATDESENFQTVLEDDVSVLLCLDSKGLETLQTDVSSDTGAMRRASESSVSTCDAMVGTTLTSFTAAFTQSENPETADKSVLTELYMSDLDEIAKEFIKMKTTLEEQREKVKSSGCGLRKQCDCLQRAQRAELHLLTLQYNMCTQHCWRLYYISAEGGHASTLAGAAQHWVKEPPCNIGGVLQKLEVDYYHMRDQILDGVPLQQLKPLCVDSEKISSGASYTPALMIGDVVGNPPSRRPQEKTSGEDRGRCGDGTTFLESETQGNKAKEEKMTSKRAVTLIPQNRSAHQGAAHKDLNTSEAWYDAEEVLDPTEPAETQPDPTTIAGDGTNSKRLIKPVNITAVVAATESAGDEVNDSRSLLCVTNLTGHVTESEVMMWFEKYGASEVKISVLKNDLRVAIAMVSDLQSAEAAVKEMNGISVDSHTLHVGIISGGGAAVSAAAAASPTSSQEDDTRRQPLTTEPRVSDRESKTPSSLESTFPPPLSSGIKRRTVVSVTPTAQGTFVPQHFGTMGSFDYLMSELTRLHPCVDKQRFVDALVQLRARHRGVLCGLPLSKIREMASELLSGSQTDTQI